jgi:hypothetical protein
VTTPSVNYEAVHRAQKLVGEKLNEQRLARIKARNDAHVAAGGVLCGYPGCTRPGRRFMNMRACKLHQLFEPHQPPTTCDKPLVCYRECCAGRRQTSDERRAEYDAQVIEWRANARSEIMTIARIGLPFGPRELAAVLPVKLARQAARDWLLALLDDGVNHGVLVQLSEFSWRMRREHEPIQHVEPRTGGSYVTTVDADRVERDNRYQ